MTGGGGVLDFKMSPEEIAVEWSDFEKQQHINWLEMLMVWWSIAGKTAGRPSSNVKIICSVNLQNMLLVYTECWLK